MSKLRGFEDPQSSVGRKKSAMGCCLAIYEFDRKCDLNEHCSKSTTKCSLIKLYQGDGESLPDTPPNEAAIVHQDSKVKNDNKTVHPFSLDIKVFVNTSLRGMMILITTMMTRLTAWQWVF